MEFDFDGLAVEIIRKIEEMGLEPFAGRIELRAYAQIGCAIEHPAIGQAALDRINPVTRAQIAAHLDIGGGKAELTPVLFAMLDHALYGKGAGQEQGRSRAIANLKRIADATSLPLICFQYPIASGLGYPFDTLLKLFDAVPTIRAIKDWSNDAMLHERHIRTFQNLPRPVNVLTTHSTWLMASLSMGANGLLSGAGSVIADLQVALFRAVRAGDLKAAQAVNDRIYPLAQAFYAPPFLDMHNRMKECLVLLGRIGQAYVRPPLVKLTQSEIDRLQTALNQAGIRRETALASAA